MRSPMHKQLSHGIFCPLSHVVRQQVVRQQGFAALLVVMVLLVGMTTISLTVSRSGMLEQAITGNGLRALEAQKAAEAALEYVMAWATTAWATTQPIPVGTTVYCGTDLGCPALPTDLAGIDGGTFVLTVQFTRDSADSSFVKVSATATQSDNNSAATVSCYIKQDTSSIPYKVIRIPGTWKDF
jgi:Tfp pilus assembly protein PilX